jgi:hypothetical protein
MFAFSQNLLVKQGVVCGYGGVNVLATVFIFYCHFDFEEVRMIFRRVKDPSGRLTGLIS